MQKDKFIIIFKDQRMGNLNLSDTHNNIGYIVINQEHIQDIFSLIKLKYKNQDIEIEYFAINVYLDFNEGKCYFELYYKEPIYIIDFEYGEPTL